MFNNILYVATALLLGLSWFKDKKRTKMALIKAWKSFENILPQFLCVILLIGMMLSVLDKAVISRLLGQGSGAFGYVIAAVVGSITLIPGFVAFPLAASLLASGAGYGQITMFITTLMMVGVVTLPVETKYFGKKIAVKRNLLALCFAVVVSLVIGGFIA